MDSTFDRVPVGFNPKPVEALMGISIKGKDIGGGKGHPKP